MVSIKDIALACGVSTATVSKALNNREDVNAATRERVQEAARQLGYMPNATARALKTNKTFNIGVLLVDKAGSGLNHYYFASILDSFKVAMEHNGYDLTLISNQNSSYYDHCIYRNVDGVFAACVDFGTEEMQNLLDSSLPAVSVDYVSPGKYAVVSDNAQGTRKSVEYAIRMGHTRLAFIYGEDSQVTTIRKDAFLRTMAAHNIPAEERFILPGKYLHTELAYHLTLQLLQEKDAPSCILYPDDMCAVAGMAAIRDKQLVPGKDVSVIGYDGNPALRMLGPRLTTVQQDTREIGNRAAVLMLRQLKKEDIPADERVSSVGVSLLEGDTVARLV